jgi:branched-chain amino acid transport system substrate-binding protein
LKRIVFLIVGVLLVLGLVLPGCGGTTTPTGSPYHGLVTSGTLTIGVIGDMHYETGQDARDGAGLAVTDVSPFMVGNTSVTITKNVIDDSEVDYPLDSGPYVTAAIPNCDFMVGGFRTEGVVTYLPQLMAANMTYIDCGAATTSLAMNAVTNYNVYKYFFRGTPMNDYLLNHSLTKLLESFLLYAEISYIYGPGAGHEFLPQIAVVAESALWADLGAEMSQAGAERLGLNATPAPYRVGTLYSVGQVTSVLNNLKAANNYTNIIAVILSGPVGKSYADAVTQVFPNAMSVGINVEAQSSSFPGTIGAPKNALNEMFLDGWASGVNITSSTASFVTAFVNAYGHLPLYTAGTYDAIKSLVAAVQNKGLPDGTTVKYKPGDIVTYLEGSVTETAAGNTGFYPKWDGTTRGTFVAYPGDTPQNNVPALNENQVRALYPWLENATYAQNVSGNLTLVPWSYDEDDWTMPPLPTHDLVYGVKWDASHAWATSIASQWKYVGGNITKVCIWPNNAVLTLEGSGLAAVTSMPYFVNNILPTLNASSLYALEGYPLNPELTALDLWDQFGWWNTKYPGTGSMNITGFLSQKFIKI